MARILVWDLPTRVFHWLLTLGLLACFGFAFLAEEESSTFSAHMIIGIVVGIMVALRIVWGFVGTRYARFGSFLFSPTAVVRYTKEAVAGSGQRHTGHNPGSSYAIFAMLALVGVVVATGLLMSNGSEAFEGLHEIASYALLAVIVVHIAGVVFYTLQHRENVTLSMIDGIKEGSPKDAISSSRPLAAWTFVVLVVLLTAGLFRNYDRARGLTKLPVFGTVIQLGEHEENEQGEEEGEEDGHER